MTHSNDYRLYFYANYKYDAAINKYVMHIIIVLLNMSKSAIGN